MEHGSFIQFFMGLVAVVGLLEAYGLIGEGAVSSTMAHGRPFQEMRSRVAAEATQEAERWAEIELQATEQELEEQEKVLMAAWLCRNQESLLFCSNTGCWRFVGGAVAVGQQDETEQGVSSRRGEPG